MTLYLIIAGVSLVIGMAIGAALVIAFAHICAEDDAARDGSSRPQVEGAANAANNSHA